MSRRQPVHFRCSAGDHARCSYLLKATKRQLLWCYCPCHHSSVQDQVRAQQLTRGLFPVLEQLPAEVSVSPVSAPAAAAVVVDTPAAVVEPLVDQPSATSS
jgi:hypothetical protein